MVVSGVQEVHQSEGTFALLLLGSLAGGWGTYSALSSLPADPHPTPTEETVVWILPFTSGGFLYIALVNVLPDLLEEDDPW